MRFQNPNLNPNKKNTNNQKIRRKQKKIESFENRNSNQMRKFNSIIFFKRVFF